MAAPMDNRHCLPYFTIPVMVGCFHQSWSVKLDHECLQLKTHQNSHVCTVFVQFVDLIVFSMLLKHRCSLSRELGPLSVVKMSLEVGAMNRCNQHWCYLNTCQILLYHGITIYVKALRINILCTVQQCTILCNTVL